MDMCEYRLHVAAIDMVICSIGAVCAPFSGCMPLLADGTYAAVVRGLVCWLRRQQVPDSYT
jgi:hypothetical protein